VNRSMVMTAIAAATLFGTSIFAGGASIAQVRPGHLPSVQKKLPPPKVSPSPGPGVDLAITEIWWTKQPIAKSVVGGVNNSQIMVKVANQGTVVSKLTNVIYSCTGCPPSVNTTCMVSPIKPGDFQWCSRPSVATGEKWASPGDFTIEAQVDKENVNNDTNLSNNKKSLQFTVAGLPDSIHIKSAPVTAPYNYCIIGKACGLTWELNDVGTDKVILELWKYNASQMTVSAVVPNKGFGAISIPKDTPEAAYRIKVISQDRKRSGMSEYAKVSQECWVETVRIRPKQIITLSKRQGTTHMMDDPCAKYDGEGRGMTVRQYYHVYDWSCTNMTYVYYDFNAISINPAEVMEANMIGGNEDIKGGISPSPENYICEIAHATNNLWTVPRGQCFRNYPTIGASTDLVLSYLKKERKHWGFLYIIEDKSDRPYNPNIQYRLMTIQDPALSFKLRRCK
jgi:hypothetical protein